MKYIIYKVDYKYRCFYVVINGKLEAFYLSNRLAKLFLSHLDSNVVVSFSITNKRKKHQGRYMYQVNHFNYIASLQPQFVIYDLVALRKEMEATLNGFEYFLFLDCEMTMPGYGQTIFSPELIQVGYLLSNREGEVIVEDSYYLSPLKNSSINRRTIKFLHLDSEEFFKKALSYNHFYDHLAALINKYHPKIVVWGKNDIQAIQSSFELHNLKPLTKQKDYIDLLKLHKDYFNLKDDIGLFKAYQAYYGDSLKQVHDAKTDAIITKDIFSGFMKLMKDGYGG